MDWRATQPTFTLEATLLPNMLLGPCLVIVDDPNNWSVKRLRVVSS